MGKRGQLGRGRREQGHFFRRGDYKAGAGAGAGDGERLRTDDRDWLEAGNLDTRLKFPSRWSDAKAEGINALLSTRSSLRLSGFHSLGAKWQWPWS